MIESSGFDFGVFNPEKSGQATLHAVSFRASKSLKDTAPIVNAPESSKICPG